ncbi:MULTISPECIES: hypothetical protein [unclassified Sphingomonas]|uniref:hypothetical protein n=1 Tax=Sphingomonas TaxID=13687 RepID=UPI00285E4FEE|nr:MULTISPECIES: hypothetical protein [unclassified Sphingomonas]MDR6116279.1 hypothetical protein [Sphingomonas sp. SORGH_AS_0789]MDR6150046.1 hypothetical protein [Sphingomonas sp. SORGH_AS_0742]
MVSRAAQALLCAAFLSAVPAWAAPPQEGGDAVQIVLKFVKHGSPDRPVARFQPESCPACAPVTTPLFNADNPRETVVALHVPRRRSLELAFDGPRLAVRRVLLSGGDVPFRSGPHGVVVQLPPVATDAITAAEVATHIVEPGMVLRFEHADPARRAGAYATGPFPDRQRRTANVLEFAQREVVRRLGLGEEAEREGLGRIQIMGFDTNAPHGHVDAPPHVHMHLRWPDDTGTQIGHYYIGPDGLLTENIVGVKGLGTPERRFGRGDTFTSIAPDGRGLYSHRITARGWLEIARPGGRSCLIKPDGGAGFDAGAQVVCGDEPATRIAVTDDLRGVLTVVTGPVTEVFRYDPDTGALLSPAIAPAPPPSVFVADTDPDIRLVPRTDPRTLH